jgi:hypothetical protein
VAGESQTITVAAGGEDLISKTPTAHTDLDSDALTKIPYQNTSAGLSSLLTLATPGIAQDSDGLIHAQGEHQDVQFSLDGQPITDQQSRQFSNQISLSSVQSLEVISGVAPAEYGDKASLVVRAITKSGLNETRAHGNAAFTYGSFGTSTLSAGLGYGNAKFGTFTAVDGVNSGRFLDTPEFRPLHDHGNVENFFERLDYIPNDRNTFKINMGLARSWAQQPNQYDQQAAGQDQRNEIKSFNVSPEYTHMFNTNLLLDTTAYVRQDQVHYYPSKNPFSDLPATLSQSRRLTNVGIKADLNYSAGINNAKFGVNFFHTFLGERFGIGITDPAFNAPCLNQDGQPITDPSAQPPCAGANEQVNPNYNAGLAPYDLSRGGTLFNFRGNTDIKEVGLYARDEVRLRDWLISFGIRGDIYRGLVSNAAFEPRVGLAYTVAKTNTVLRASYGRFFLTPYNENLILSSSTGVGGLNSNVFGAQGQQPLRPGSQNYTSVGFEQAIGSHIAVQADYFWKYAHRDYDFDVLFNTPLSFPIQWKQSKIDGLAVRVNVTPVHGFSAYSVIGHTRSRFFGPEVGGILFNSPVDASVFRIDHDQAFQQVSHFQYQPFARAPWVGFNWNYQSGLVAGHAPFATDTTTPVDLTYLTPDQQAQAQITCGGVRATILNPFTNCAPNLLSSPLLSIPAPGTENSDRNPPRIAPRTTFDASVGVDDIFRRERLKTNLQFTVVNLTNKYALYNYLSTFSGTHFVAPRTFTAQIGVTF